MTKHTPGPWVLEGFEQILGGGTFYGGLIVGGDDETIVAQCVMPHNARLIAAAPELLEALKNIVNLWDHHASAHGDGTIFPLHVAARAAIAKAEGAT